MCVVFVGVVCVVCGLWLVSCLCDKDNHHNSDFCIIYHKPTHPHKGVANRAYARMEVLKTYVRYRR